MTASEVARALLRLLPLQATAMRPKYSFPELSHRFDISIRGRDDGCSRRFFRGRNSDAPLTLPLRRRRLVVKHLNSDIWSSSDGDGFQVPHDCLTDQPQTSVRDSTCRRTSTSRHHSISTSKPSIALCFDYKNSTPIPNCNPFLIPSPTLAVIGTPAFNSTRNWPCRYTTPTPTLLLGCASSFHPSIRPGES